MTRATIPATERHTSSTVSIQNKVLLPSSAQTNVGYAYYDTRVLTVPADVSIVTTVDNHEAVGTFFHGFALPRA